MKHYLINNTEETRLLREAEKKLDDLRDRFEKEFKMVNDNLKETIYQLLNIHKSDGDKYLWNMISVYYPTLGFYILEQEDNPMLGLFPEKIQLNPTLQ